MEAGTSVIDFSIWSSLGEIGMIKPELLSSPFLGTPNWYGHWIQFLHEMSKMTKQKTLNVL